MLSLLLVLTHLKTVLESQGDFSETSAGVEKMKEERKYCVIFCLDAHVSAFRMCGGSRAFCHG